MNGYSEIAVFAIVEEARYDQADAFYLHHGFLPLGSRTRQLMLPLAKIAAGP